MDSETEMNIPHAQKNADRFHKTTLLLASKVTGVPYQLLLRDRFKTLPIIVSDGKTLALYFEGSNRGDTDFITPYVVNGAFSLELCLKILRYHEAKEWPSGHNLSNLYEKLSQASKDFIAQDIYRAVHESPLFERIMKAINDEFKISFSWDPVRMIEESSNAFVSWRYSFQLRPGWFAGYKEIRASVMERIKRLEQSAS
jgi:hypothetical protein